MNPMTPRPVKMTHLPEPQRSQFDPTELLKRLADLEARIERLEDQKMSDGNFIVGCSEPIRGSGVRI